VNQAQSPPPLVPPPGLPERAPFVAEPTIEEVVLLRSHHMIATVTAPTVAPDVKIRATGFDEESPSIVEEAREGA